MVTSFAAPSTGIIGTNLANMKAVVTNQGGAKAGAFRVAFYYSKSSAVSTSDMYSGWSCGVDGLDAGSSFTCYGDLGMPDGITPGSYYLAVIADDQQKVTESDESNNVRTSSGGPVVLSYTPLPDLVVTSFTAPTSGQSGDRLTGTKVVVQNRGSAAASPFRIGYYYSAEKNVTSNSISSGWSCTASGGLEVGATFTCGGDIGIPSGLPSGTYYAAAIVDDLGRVEEADEDNNVRLNDNGPVALKLNDPVYPGAEGVNEPSVRPDVPSAPARADSGNAPDGADPAVPADGRPNQRVGPVN